MNLGVQATVVTNDEPVAAISADPQSGDAPLDVTFDASASHDPDGTIVSYDWDFGDGFTGTGAMPTHSYDSAAVYTVTLEVTDDGAGFDTRRPDDRNKGQVTGFGLFSIREQIQYYGGQLAIHSEPGMGTRVTLSLPVENRTAVRKERDDDVQNRAG